MSKHFLAKRFGTRKTALERTPEHGWDCAIDVRQGRRWLRERGDTVRTVLPGVATGTELAAGMKPLTEDQVQTIREVDVGAYIRQLRSFGIRPRTTIQILRDQFHDRSDLDVKFISQLTFDIYTNAASQPGAESAAGEKVPDGMAFKTNQLGKPVNCAANLAIAFVRLGVSFRYDAFADRYLIDGLADFGPYMDDASIRRLRFDIDRKYGFLPDEKLIFDYCYDSARYYAFDPVNDYFDRVQELWDKKPRIDRFLTDYAGAEDTPYIRAVSKLLFLSIVRRQRAPGSKFDEMIVLESDQGKDKSSALAVLALKEDWFSDSFPMNAANRETLEHAQGKIIIEVAELQGMRKADIEHVKAMLSRTTDRGRMVYAKAQSEQARRFIFIGTSNGRNYLQDATGNRRFWPVAVKAFDIPAVRRNLKQLWGEAAWREALGESIRMDRALWSAAGVEQEKRLAAGDDPFTDTFRAHLGDKVGRITAEDCWKLLGIDPGRRTPELNRRFGAALKAIGWRPMTIKTEPGKDGPRVRGYGSGDALGNHAPPRIVVARNPDREMRAVYEGMDHGVTGANDFGASETPDFG